MATKKPSKGQINFAKDFLGLTEEDLAKTEKTEVRSNWLSGKSVAVTPAVAKAIDFVYKLQIAFDKGNVTSVHPKLTRGNAVQKFDTARMLVLALDSGAYMDILD